jgi:hypothetical protein
MKTENITKGSPGTGDETSAKLPNMDGNEFDLSRFAVDMGVQEFAGGRKLLNTVPVRKPAKESWIRTHPNVKEFWFKTYVLDLKEYNESYLVTPDIREYLLENGEQTLSRQVLITSITRQGTLFLWAIKLPQSDGSSNQWNESAIEAAALARTSWMRLQSDRSLGAYSTVVRDGGPEPAWPNISMQEIVKIAFKGKIIDSLSHPRLAELLGNEVVTRKSDPLEELAKSADSAPPTQGEPETENAGQS